MTTRSPQSFTSKYVLIAAVIGAFVVLGICISLIGGLRRAAETITAGVTQTASAQGMLRMPFPEDMDKESVEQELVIPASLEGETQWDGGTLVFVPSKPLEAGATYEFVVGRNAKRSDSSAVGREFVFRFVISGDPAVTARMPAPDATDVSPRTNITIVFDRPMVALAQVQGAPTGGEWPVTISPRLSGRWRWISTYAAQFRPDGGLTPSTLYTVTVPAGIPTAGGEKTPKDMSWKFETERMRVTASDPEPGYALAGPVTQPKLTFNQEVSLESLAKHVRLLKREGTGSGIDIAVGSVKFALEKNDDKTVPDKTAAIIVPKEPLARSASYTLVITPGLLGAKGDLGTAGEYSLPFSTVGPLNVVSTAYEYGSLQLQFSSPLDANPDARHVTFTPPLSTDATVSVSTNYWADGRQLTVSPSALEPSTTYTLTVTKDFADAYGQHLTEPYAYTFTTPPTPPEIALAYSKGEFGIFERGKAPVYYVNAVNVSAINAEFAKLTLADFMAIRTRRYGDWRFVPDLKGKSLYRSWSLPGSGKQNAWKTTPVDMNTVATSSLAPGIYALLLRAPEVRDGEPIVLQQYFVITNTGLTLKYSGDKALVWATDLETGKPVAGANIAFHALGGRTPVQGKTDAQGFFESAVSMKDFKNQPYEWQPEFWVTAEKAGDFAFVSSQWNGGFQPGDFSLWSDFHSADAPPYRLMQQMVTDRPVYRPGDTVSFKGIVRLKDWNGNLQLPGSKHTMQVIIQSPDGTEVQKTTLPFSPYGGFSGTFKTSESAPLGQYSFQLALLPESDTGGYVYTQGFTVLAYRKPEYRVDLTTASEDYYDGDTIEADIEGAYYFGAPLADAPVTWRATLLDWHFNRYTDGWYSFSEEENWCWQDCGEAMTSLTEGTGKLDASGRLKVKVPAAIGDKTLSQIATIEADVTDPNNQLVSNRVSVPVHKSSVYVGVQNQDYAVAPGQSARIGVITVDVDGKPLPGTRVTLRLLSRTWNSIRKKGVDGEYYFENDHTDTFIRSQTVTTGADGKTTAQVSIPTGGQFVVIAEATDSKGRTAKAGTSVYAWSSTYVNWPHENNDRVDVIADKPEYAVGDTAKLLVKSPFQGEGVKALVTVERENVMTKTVLDVTSNALPIEIPITEDLVPNAYVSVVIVKPRQGETFDDEGRDTGVPAFRVGYVQLRVETAKKKLDVSVTTDKSQYLPGEKVSATLTVKDSAGKPVQGEFTFAAVDMSVLALAGFRPPDIVANFYSDHGLGVYTSQMLTYLVERFKPGSKGGGGADPEDRKRGNFRDTAYWNPAVVTDANGKASISFDLPDNLTTWQLLAVGGTKDGKFGVDDLEIVETKNVIIRPVRPRFAVRGDRITLGAIVHNFLPGTRTFAVNVSGTGFAHAGEATKTVTLKTGEMAKLAFPVTVGSVDGLAITMKAETDGARDEIEEKIPVHIFGTPQSVATTGQTESVVTEKILVPSEKDASSGTLDITVSPSLATYLPGGLEYVLEYPYGCAEQTASAFLPHVALKKLQGFDAFKIVNDQALAGVITTSLQKLYRFQRPDGGFGYWEESPESQPYLTAYILYALRLAKETGHSVDASVMQRAAAYLSGVLRADGKLAKAGDLPLRAYILYVLAETGNPDANLLNNLYDRRQELPVFSQAELAMALQKSGMQKKSEEVLGHILNNAIVDPRGAHVEEPRERSYRIFMQTNTRTTAETLQAMIRIDPGNQLIPQFVRFLLAARKDGHWDSTQSTVQTILAFTEYLKSTNELSADYIAGIEVNGTIAATQKFSRQNILTRKEVTLALKDLKRGQQNDVRIGVDRQGRLFYDVLLSYFHTGDTIEPADQGIGILRELGSLDPKGPQSVSTVKAGETYRVTLTVTVPEDRYFVAVESPHPAGLEGIDPQLQTSRQTGLPDDVMVSPVEPWWFDEDDDNGLWRFNHKEFRDDRVFLFADYLPAGVYKYTYLVRATTPGTFRQRPAHVFEMYFPETFGQTAGGWFTVNE